MCVSKACSDQFREFNSVFVEKKPTSDEADVVVDGR